MDKGKGATLANKVLTIDKYLVEGDDKQTKYFLTLFRFFLAEKMFVVVVTGLTLKFCVYMDRVPSFRQSLYSLKLQIWQHLLYFGHSCYVR